MWQGGIGLDQHLRVLYLFQQRCSGTGAKTVHINIHDSQRWCDQRCIRVIVEGDNRNVLRNAQAELTDCLDDADGDKTVKAQNAVGRFLSYCEGDLRRFRLAEVFLFTSPGIPCVFYGDELGMDGSSETTLRGPMPWEKVQDGEDDFFPGWLLFVKNMRSWSMEITLCDIWIMTEDISIREPGEITRL